MSQQLNPPPPPSPSNPQKNSKTVEKKKNRKTGEHWWRESVLDGQGNRFDSFYRPLSPDCQKEKKKAARRLSGPSEIWAV